MYDQLGNKDGLIDLELTVNAHSPKVYHLGFGKGVSKANLGKANAHRNWHIYLYSNATPIPYTHLDDHQRNMTNASIVLLHSCIQPDSYQAVFPVYRCNRRNLRKPLDYHCLRSRSCIQSTNCQVGYYI